MFPTVATVQHPKHIPLPYHPVVKRIFISGGTGYIGRAITPRLLASGHQVTILVRPGSEGKAPPGAKVVIGDALAASTFDCSGADTFLHLVGAPHPAPWKGQQFRSVDLPALHASVEAAVRARVGHFIFLSVAQPAPVMRAYVDVRQQCERIVRQAGLSATIVRPWYVLGPGHRWPLALLPFYKAAEHISSLREGARRLGLVTLEQMVETLVWAIENPPARIRVLEVPEILNRGVHLAARV
jgi:nucleoside-diphosphate-sugar epimerase